MRSTKLSMKDGGDMKLTMHGMANLVYLIVNVDIIDLLGTG